MFVCIITDCITDLIADIILQPTLFNGQHLIKCTWNMETDSIHLIVLHFSLHLLFCKPTLVRESKFQLVSIKFSLFRSQDWRNLRQFHLTDSSKIIGYLLLLVFDLVFVTQTLPLTTTAYSVMLTERNRSFRRKLMEFYGYRFGILVLLAFYLQVHYITRNYIWYEYHQIVHFRQSLTFGSYICYCYLL